MAWTLIAALVFAVAVAGTIMVANRVTGGLLPRWTIPAGAGLGMLGFVIWTEYTWMDTVTGVFPPEVTVVKTYDYSSALQPWTLVVPRINRFVAIDSRRIEVNAKTPHFRKTDALLFTRFEPAQAIGQIYDCETPRRLDLPPQETIDPTTVADDAWQPVAADDPLRAAVCAAEVS